MANPICSRTMKVQHLIALVAVMLFGVAYAGDVKYEATFTGVT